MAANPKKLSVDRERRALMATSVPTTPLRRAAESGQTTGSQRARVSRGWRELRYAWPENPEGYYNVERMLQSIARRGEVAT